MNMIKVSRIALEQFISFPNIPEQEFRPNFKEATA